MLVKSGNLESKSSAQVLESVEVISSPVFFAIKHISCVYISNSYLSWVSIPRRRSSQAEVTLSDYCLQPKSLRRLSIPPFVMSATSRKRRRPPSRLTTGSFVSRMNLSRPTLMLVKCSLQIFSPSEGA